MPAPNGSANPCSHVTRTCLFPIGDYPLPAILPTDPLEPATMDSDDSILLRLLDAVLSQHTEEADTIVTEAQERLQSRCDGRLILPEPTKSVVRSNPNLLMTVESLLGAYPALASARTDRDQSLPLHFAASLGNLPLVSLLYHHNKAAASCRNGKGKTPLHFAAREGRLEVVHFLVDQAPHVAAIATDKKKLPLHFAAADGHEQVCRKLLQVYPEGARLSSGKGKTCLHFCARWGHIGVARVVLDIHPEAAQTADAEYSLPLHDAVRGAQLDMCRFLVNLYPASVTVSNMRGEIPLYGAVRSGNLELCALFLQSWPKSGAYILQNACVDDCVSDWDWEVVEMLLRGAAGNFIGCKHFVGILPLPATCAKYTSFRRAIMTRARSPLINNGTQEPRTKRIKIPSVIPYEETITTPNQDLKFLPLHTALATKVSGVALDHIWKTCPETCETVDSRGRTAVHWAATWSSDKSLSTLSEMIRQTPDAATIRDSTGHLPLHLAIQHGASIEVLKSLLEVYPESGAQNCESRDEFQKLRPIHMACHHGGSLDVVFHLLCLDPAFVTRKVPAGSKP